MRRGLVRILPFAGLVAVAAVVVVVRLAADSDGRDPPEPLAVEAESIYQFAALDEMVAATDAVVSGTVVAVEEGRLVGDPDAGGIVSRTVTIAVSDVLSGEAAATVLVEEEGWLPDGTPLVVNGVAPTEEGDEGVWFLDGLDDPEFPGYLVINSQGRYLVVPDDPAGPLAGGDQDDALVQELQAMSRTELEAAVREAAQ